MCLAIEGETSTSEKKTHDDFIISESTSHPKHHRHDSHELPRPRKSSENLQDQGGLKKVEVLETPTKKKKVGQSVSHAITNRDFDKVHWVRKNSVEDVSRLPSVYHILFAILDSPQETPFTALLQKYPVQSLKLVKRLGAFLVCENEKQAEELFHVLSKEFSVFPLKELPRQIKVDQLRSEICFMEGVRPPKSTAAAERFMYKHLGFKDAN